MPDDYKIKDNRHSQVYAQPEDPLENLPFGTKFFHLLRKITNYQKPLEEREVILKEAPDPVSEFIKEYSDKSN